MEDTRTRRLGWLLAGACLLALGCQEQDTDRLAQVGRRLARKAEALSADANSTMVQGIQAVRADLDEVAIDARVATRLKWDKSLVGLAIHVRSEEGHVHLVGAVPSAAQKSRAVELAESTIGVLGVTDEIEVSEQLE